MKKRYYILPLVVAAALAVFATSDTVAPKAASSSGTVSIYRLYNPHSGEHFYTTQQFERNSLVDSGWDYEGTGWTESATQGSDVYRLYNPNAGDHYYTMNAYERDTLVSKGWRYEGVSWKSSGSVNVSVAYNPNAVAGAHNYTTNPSEQSNLLKSGWIYGATAWKAIGAGTSVAPLTSLNIVGDFPDPDVFYDNGTYYMYGTFSGKTHIQLATSKNGINFSRVGDALPSFSKPGATAAPFVTKINGKYIMYYHYISGGYVIGVATASSPAGPFIPSSHPLLVPPTDSSTKVNDIFDADIFSSNGNNFLLYSSQTDTVMATWLVQLSSDGLSVVGTPTMLLDSSQITDFYTGRATSRVESPSLTQAPDGTYVMFYGANDADKDTGYVGYATAPSIAGPYTDHGAILRSLNTGVGGPDEMQLFQQNGINRFYFNGWDGPHNSWNNPDGHGRSVYSMDFHWANGHTPVVNANLN